MASTTSFGDQNKGLQAGIINGGVTYTHHPPPKSPPLPSIVIPFARDADFVERGTTLEQLKQICAAPDARAALVGLGGINKSQLAIEYAYRTYEQSPETWVFWIHASNAARFEQSFRDIADCVQIAGRKDSRANIFKLVHDWLRGCKQHWLLVLDNVDDARFLIDNHATDSKTAQQPLREYLPHWQRGSMLITTRNKEAALSLVESRDTVAVEPMDEAQAQALFVKKLGTQGDSDFAELAAALEYMPLAMVQAAAYILQRAPRYSVAKYLQEFRKSERKRSSLLTYDNGQLRRDWEARNSIVVTWQISFEYIQRTQPSAADLLSLMSFFDRQGIPEALLRVPKSQRGFQMDQQERKAHILDRDEEDTASNSTADDECFEEDIVALRNFHFISINTSDNNFEMHALVQLATRMWLSANHKLEQWKQKFISNLCAAFPTGEHENWATCQALFAHAKSAASQPPKGDSSLAEWATLLYHAAWYAGRKGNIAEAMILAIKSIEARKKVLGPEHTDTLWSIAQLGRAYALGGQWKLAEGLELQVLETRKRKLGVDHVDTINSLGTLASIYSKQGRWNEAEIIETQALEICKTKLGADHRDTLVSMSNLALISYRQGRWNDAEILKVQVLETRKRELGVDHLHTLISMGILALIYSKQGRWNDAEMLEVQVLETRKRELGVDHRHTLISMGNLALTYSKQGRWSDAETLQVQVLEARRTKLGVNHPETLTSMHNLACTWKDLGRQEEAMELLRECVQRGQRVLGENHPYFVSFLARLAKWEERAARGQRI